MQWIKVILNGAGFGKIMRRLPPPVKLEEGFVEGGEAAPDSTAQLN